MIDDRTTLKYSSGNVWNHSSIARHDRQASVTRVTGGMIQVLLDRDVRQRYKMALTFASGSTKPVLDIGLTSILTVVMDSGQDCVR